MALRLLAAPAFAAALLPGATTQSQAPPPDLARGATLYLRMCAVCHGPEGEGYKADNAPSLAEPDFLGGVSDAFLANAIAQGRNGTTMSAWSAEYGGPLNSTDTAALVAYLRRWETGPKPSLDERPLGGDPDRGATLFAANCASCHGATGKRGDAVGIGNPALLRDATNGFLRRAIAAGRPGRGMPAYGEALGEPGVEDLVAWLRVLESSGTAGAPPRAEPAPPPKAYAPLNPAGPDPEGFHAHPRPTPADRVKRELDRGAKLAFLDARPPSDYLAEHIAGAISVPFYDPGPHLSALPRDAWLVCYCACPHAEAGRLAESLARAGFTKVTVLDEGLPYWRSKGYGTRRGPAP